MGEGGGRLARGLCACGGGGGCIAGVQVREGTQRWGVGGKCLGHVPRKKLDPAIHLLAAKELGANPARCAKWLILT